MHSPYEDIRILAEEYEDCRKILLAPTAMNQQKFVFTLQGDQVSAKAGMGFYTKLDLGIVKYHFEIGAGDHHFEWVL